ncbi:hypothetical protein ACFU5O_12975 [Streptomyces sp. NPDC057445]|uniref:hypothetical protein n=1 Tax=Streptomyces sp. NPDC057445 TaxID=3346136 RepID=UPI00367C2ADE
MLALRLARGTHPLILLRRLMVAAASGGVGFLLLCTLAGAMARTEPSPEPLLRLLWCLVPLAATVQFAVAVARTDPSTRPRPGLSAVGLGPVRLTALAAVSTAVACTLGSMLALLVFLHLRGDLTGLPFDGAAPQLLSAEQPLPLGAALTLLGIVPVAAAGAAAIALRPRRTKPVDGFSDEGEDARAGAAPAGLPWGVALTAAGLAVESYAGTEAAVGTGAHPPAGVLAGWALSALGLAVAGPGIAHLCGRVLQSMRPGAVRLLAGRALMDDAVRIGRPLGVLSAVASAMIAATTLSRAGTTPRPFGELTELGATLVLVCTVATLFTSVLDVRHARAAVREGLRGLGTPASFLRASALLRTLILMVIFAPLTWAVAALAAVPLRH